MSRVLIIEDDPDIALSLRVALERPPREGVLRAHVDFHLVSDDIVPTFASVGDVRDPTAFDVRALGRLHLEVDLGSTSIADRIAIRNSDGERLSILEMRADGYSTYDEFPLTNGRSGVVSITTNATELQLLQGTVVLESIPIAPRPGQPLSISR